MSHCGKNELKKGARRESREETQSQKASLRSQLVEKRGSERELPATQQLEKKAKASTVQRQAKKTRRKGGKRE